MRRGNKAFPSGCPAAFGQPLILCSDSVMSIDIALGWTSGSAAGQHTSEFVAIASPARPDGKRFSTYMDMNFGRNEQEAYRNNK